MDNFSHRGLSIKANGSSYMLGQGSASAYSGGSSMTKTRALVYHFLSSTLHELLLYKIAQRTPWPNALILLPIDAGIHLAFFATLGYLASKKGVKFLQPYVGNQDASRPSSTWRDIAPLAGCTILSTAAYFLQAGYLQMAVTATVAPYIAPMVLLGLPIVHLPLLIPSNGSIVTLAYLVPFTLALGLLSYDAAAAGGIFLVVYVVAEAFKLSLSKQWSVAKSAAPLDTLMTVTPVVLVLTSLTLLPVSLHYGAGTHKPFLWQLYILFYSISSLAHQFFQHQAVQLMESPVSVAFLSVPRGLLTTLLHGGIAGGSMSNGATRQLYTTLVCALAALSIATPDLRDKLRLSRFTAVLGTSSPNGQAERPPFSQRLLLGASMLPLALWLYLQAYTIPISLRGATASLRAQTPRLNTVDIVVSYYDEPVDQLFNFTQNLLYYPWIRHRDPRFILYVKNDAIDAEALRKQVKFDEVYRLENKGREAGSYLRHILSRYNQSVDPALSKGYRTGLADHTLFFQGHMSWFWIAQERLWLFQDDTGYLHLAPYIKMNCDGRDLEGNGHFVRYPQIYSIFREQFCPNGYRLSAYAGQFVVSKQRILQNSYAKYKMLDDTLEADRSHWIHSDSEWDNFHGVPLGPANPFLGHALERSWPVIFDCDREEIADNCNDDKYPLGEGCQCLDSG